MQPIILSSRVGILNRPFVMYLFTYEDYPLTQGVLYFSLPSDRRMLLFRLK